MNEITIRVVNEQDIDELLSIYSPYVTDTAITFEYQIPSREEFKNRVLGTLRRYPYYAAVVDGKIMGYAYASAFKGRAAYDWSCETSIYVRKDSHGHGIGKALYTKLEETLKQQNIRNLCACIAYPNPESIPFHESFGYKQNARFTKSGFKFNTWHDMIWMEKFINPHDPFPEPFIPFSEL